MPTEDQVRTVASGAAKTMLPWEVGGFFESTQLSDEATVPWPEPKIFFSLARHVVPGILRVNKSIRRLWIPHYFCPDVAQYWSQSIETASYRDDPSLPEPDWKSLQPDKHDLVVAVNFFGVRHKEPWERWRSSHDCILLEDHTHDPVSSWALTSKADYAFSSLRKSMPITDGAICWSPAGLRLPRQEGRMNEVAVGWKLAAMTAKADFLARRASPESKEHYRELFAEGDKCLEEGPESPISDHALDFVASGMPIRWREIRERNIRSLLYAVSERQGAKPLFREWPAKSVPFAFVLVFSSGKDRDNCRLHLEANNVFCPIHWPVVQAEPASGLSERILSIPADQRYGETDVARVATILNQWNPVRGSSNSPLRSPNSDANAFTKESLVQS